MRLSNYCNPACASSLLDRMWTRRSYRALWHCRGCERAGAGGRRILISEKKLLWTDGGASAGTDDHSEPRSVASDQAAGRTLGERDVRAGGGNEREACWARGVSGCTA